MATFDYAALKTNVVTNLLIKFGSAKTMVRAVTATFDPATGQTTPGTPIMLTGNAVFTEYSKFEVANGVVQAEDKKILWDGDAPEIGDQMEDYRIVDFETISPDGATNVMFIMQGRKQ